MSPIIRFEQATVITRGKTLLSDISFVLFPGDKAALCGPSGAGKSTVLRALMGLHPLNAGTVYYQEQALTALTVQSLRRCIAYIGQEPVLGADSVRAALLLPFQYKAHRDQQPSEAQLRAVLERLRLPAALLEQTSSRISGGEKQRVALARGLLLGKQVYLLDEVTSALDELSKHAVFDVFSDPALTVLSVAHDPAWLAHCGVVIKLEAGRIKQVQRHANP